MKKKKLTGEELLLLIRRSSYEIETVGRPQDVTGTGIAVSSSHLLTARHVVEGAGRLRIRNVSTGKRIVPINVTYNSKDVALITFGPKTSYFLPVARWDKQASPESLVLLWGSSSALAQLRPFTVKAGFMVGPSLTPDTDFAVSLPVVQGTSGSGIVHVDSGKTIGVVTHTYSYADRLPHAFDRSISYGASGYDLVRAAGGQVGEDDGRRRLPAFRWWRREGIAVGLGLALGVIIISIWRKK